MEHIERYRGALLGLAVGDALGAPVESFHGEKSPLLPVEDMIGHGTHNLPPGYWTDDTSMALCLAESLIERGGMDLTDQLERYVRWWRDGHLSSTGTCFDIGTTTRRALSTFERTGDPHSGQADAHQAGNGSIMRLAPVPLFFASDTGTAVNNSAESSRTTHGAREAVDACRYLGALVSGAATGVSKDDLLSDRFVPPDLTPKIAEVASGSFRRKDRADVRGSGSCVASLEAALWAFHNSRSFEEGALLAVNLGDDADTTGAVFGQLAGAYYGESSIPVEWRGKLRFRELIGDYAEKLMSKGSLGSNVTTNAKGEEA